MSEMGNPTDQDSEDFIRFKSLCKKAVLAVVSKQSNSLHIYFDKDQIEAAVDAGTGEQPDDIEVPNEYSDEVAHYPIIRYPAYVEIYSKETEGQEGHLHKEEKHKKQQLETAEMQVIRRLFKEGALTLLETDGLAEELDADIVKHLQHRLKLQNGVGVEGSVIKETKDELAHDAHDHLAVPSKAERDGPPPKITIAKPGDVVALNKIIADAREQEGGAAIVN